MQTNLSRHLTLAPALAALLALAPACHPGSASAAPGPQASATPVTAAPFVAPPVLNGTPDVATLVAKIKPAVVNITVVADAPVDDAMMEMFRSRLQNEGAPVQRRVGQGSGFVVDKEGHVVTNAHVVEGARQVKVRLADDRELKAKVVGSDPLLDLAVLKLESAPADLPVAALGASDPLRVGEYVVAIGNPFGLSHTVTMGIVSAKARTIGAGPYDDFIQTDASINPGNSGGPLFDLRGAVVGINTAINPQGKGIGFAIPVDALKDVLPQLVATGHVARGRLGVHIQPLDVALARATGVGETARGAMVADIEPGSAGARAGLHEGDVIVSVDGVAIGRSEELPRQVARHKPGSTVRLGVVREGKTISVDALLDALRGPTAAAPEAEPSRGPGLPATSIGVALRDGRDGAVVEQVVVDSPAEGELRRGDVILEVDHARTPTASDVSRRVQASPTDKPVLLKVRRGDAMRFVALERKR